MSQIETCVLIVSHPRSGTHLLMDFIRMNFRAYDLSLPLWETSSSLYVQLDHAHSRRVSRAKTFAHGGRLIAQSHKAGLGLEVSDRLAAEIKPQKVIVLYPFRRFSKMLRSFQALRKDAGSFVEFVASRDGFFGQPLSVSACARRHAEVWLDRQAEFIDMEALIADPQSLRDRLARILGETPSEGQAKLPPNRSHTSKRSEMLSRLSGRQSTAVVPSLRLPPLSQDEAATVDAHFHDLLERLRARG